MITTRRAVTALKVFLVLLFGILVVFQTLSLPGQFAYMAEQSPEDAYLRWPLTAVAVLVVRIKRRSSSSKWMQCAYTARSRISPKPL